MGLLLDVADVELTAWPRTDIEVLEVCDGMLAEVADVEFAITL